MPILGVIDSSKTGNLISPSMDFIATHTVVGSSTSQITFSNINQNYTHLHIRGFLRNDHPVYQYGNLYWQQNGVGQGQYHEAQWNSATPSFTSAGAGGSGTPFGAVPTSSIATGIYATWVLDLFDYKNTNKNKTVVFRSGFADTGTGTKQFAMGSASFANNLNATTQIMFSSLTSNFTANSKITIYGVK